MHKSNRLDWSEDSGLHQLFGGRQSLIWQNTAEPGSVIQCGVVADDRTTLARLRDAAVSRPIRRATSRRIDAGVVRGPYLFSRNSLATATTRKGFPPVSRMAALYAGVDVEAGHRAGEQGMHGALAEWIWADRRRGDRRPQVTDQVRVSGRIP